MASSKRIRTTPEQLRDFKAKWPGHGIPDDVHTIIFEFAPNGDLVDMTGSTEKRMFANLGDDSGAALSALADDILAQVYAG